MPIKQDCRFYFRLTGDDREMLDDLAEAMGVTPSGVIRMLLRKEHRTIYGNQPPAAQQKKRPRKKR